MVAGQKGRFFGGEMVRTIWLLVYVLALFCGDGANGEGFSIQKKSAAADRMTDDYPDYLMGVKYDEYPMIVPKKRAALLFDRLLVALQKAIDEEEALQNAALNSKAYPNIKPEDAMDLQRRGQSSEKTQRKGRVYWRCYFNAVTCF